MHEPRIEKSQILIVDFSIIILPTISYLISSCNIKKLACTGPEWVWCPRQGCVLIRTCTACMFSSTQYTSFRTNFHEYIIIMWVCMFRSVVYIICHMPWVLLLHVSLHDYHKPNMEYRIIIHMHRYSSISRGIEMR